MSLAPAVWIPVVGCLGACGAAPSTTSPTDRTDPDSGRMPDEPAPCSKGETFDLTVRGQVVDPADEPLGGVTITLEERNWLPGTYGTATSAGDGSFSVTGRDLPLVLEACWDNAVRFWIAGHTDGLSGDQPINSLVLGALLRDQASLDLAVPIYLDPSDR